MAGSAGGSGAAAETNPDLVLVLRLSCREEELEHTGSHEIT